jgi:uncharacterized damage-inducible protein DinB
MSAITSADRSMPDGDADERAMLIGWLDFHRATLALKCAGLTDAQLKTASMPPSTLSLLGLVRHLTDVERYWFRVVFDGEADVVSYGTDESPDDDFNDLDSAPVDEVFARWRGEQAHAAKLADRATSLDQLAVLPGRKGPPSLRWILTHMVEEYARHNGHADLLREGVDGATGF